MYLTISSESASSWMDWNDMGAGEEDVGDAEGDFVVGDVG